MKPITKLLALLIVAGFLGGCASTKDIEALRADIQQVNTKADTAMKMAEEAKMTSQAALKAAEEAKMMARDAKATSETTENKIDRMFKKAMHK